MTMTFERLLRRFSREITNVSKPEGREREKAAGAKGDYANNAPAKAKNKARNV